MTNIEKENFSIKINNLRKLDLGHERYFDIKDRHHMILKSRIDWIIPRIVGPRILDIGCASGITCRLASMKKNIKEIYGIDVCKKIIKKAKELNKDTNIKFSISFAEELKFKDNYFDSVILGETLEHVFDEKEAVKESYRVLKPNGKIIITVPYKGKVSNQHVRIFDEESIIELVGGLFKSNEFLIDVKRRKMFYTGYKKENKER